MNCRCPTLNHTGGQGYQGACKQIIYLRLQRQSNCPEIALCHAWLAAGV